MAKAKLVTVLAVIVSASIIRLMIEVVDIFSRVREIIHSYRFLDAVLMAVVGIIVIQLIASATLSAFKHLGRATYVIRNIILIIGYIALALGIGVVLGLSPEGVLAGATFSGLILGLALQPVLSNFFSGLLILLSGYLKPGQEVRIAGLPVALLSFPAYKFFSRDMLVPSLRGTIVEIGLLYTKILDLDGNLIKISNNMLLSNSMVLTETEEEKRVQIRYEFPVTCNPDEVLAELHLSLGKILGDYRLYIEEQSDKQYYIVIVITTAPPKISARAYRSEVLKEIVKVHRKLLLENRCRPPA